MKRLLRYLGLSLCVVISICYVFNLVPKSVCAVEDPFQINYSSWYLDFPSGGTQSISFTISNVSSETENITITSWWDFYVYSDPSYSWIDPSWCTRISPTSQMLAPGDSMIANVEYTLPNSVPDAKWITWVKVSDGKVLDKPIVVALRKGTSIPKYDYSLQPGDYLLDITGYGASVDVDDLTDSKAPPISVKNKTNTTGLFVAEITDCPQQEDSPEGVTIISPDTALQHDPDEIGLHLRNIPSSEASDWISFSATSESPLELGPRLTKYINWHLSIPDSLKNGDYLILVKVRPATDIPTAQVTGISTNLGVWLRLRVDRHHPTPWYLGVQGIFVLVGGSLIIAVGYLMTTMFKPKKTAGVQPVSGKLR